MWDDNGERHRRWDLDEPPENLLTDWPAPGQSPPPARPGATETDAARGGGRRTAEPAPTLTTGRYGDPYMPPEPNAAAGVRGYLRLLVSKIEASQRKDERPPWER
jgi:hypothetical protein